jgi:predicted GNAT family N-acyltransferase
MDDGVRRLAVHQAGPDDLMRIARFRYRTYVDELGRNARHANHRDKLLVEPADGSPHSRVFFTEEAGHITGTVRVTLGPFEQEEACPYTQLMDAPDLAGLPESRMVVVSRLMVSPDARGGGEGAALIERAFEFSCEHEVVLGFISCRPHVYPFFKRWGFTACGPDYEHEDVGLQRPLVVVVEPEYLRSRRSRFAAICGRHRTASPWTGTVDALLSPTHPHPFETIEPGEEAVA